MTPHFEGVNLMLLTTSTTARDNSASARNSTVPSVRSRSVLARTFLSLVRTWRRRYAAAFPIAAALVAVTCTLTPDLYEHPSVQSASDAEVAIVESISAIPHAIDGKSLEHPNPDMYYASARLPPGSHRVTLVREFVVSVLLVPSGFVTARRTYNVNLEAGHVYELHADRTTGPGFRIAMWIKDATTGEVVAGQPLG